MKVRKAKKSDFQAIKNLILANPDTILFRSDSEIENIIENFYVKEDGNKIVGCCCLEVYSSKIAEIRSVAVDKDYRMHGYGTELVNAAVQDAKLLNISEIMVITSNPHFFEKLDFKTCLNEKYALFWNDPKKP